MLDVASVMSKLEELLEELDVDKESIEKVVSTPDQTLFSDLPIDSKDELMLAMMLEEDFDIEIDLTLLSEDSSLKEFIDMVIAAKK